ncbi:MAG: hypothetical protein ACLTDS_13365 [Bianqueaceae bacterium]
MEPAHQLIQLIDPLHSCGRVNKVVHLHGKTHRWIGMLSGGWAYGAHDFAPERTPGFGDTNWRTSSILYGAGYEGDICVEGYHDPVYSGEREMTGQLHALRYLKWCRGGDFVPNPWDSKS